MNRLLSTIGKKQMVGVAGLGLSLFVLMHMLGNLLIFVGPQAYNEYAHKLTSTKVIYLMEAGLLGIFLLHIVMAIVLVLRNKGAKGSSYAVSPSKNKASFASKTMQFQGIVILLFTVLHLIGFKFGPSGEGYQAVYHGEQIRDLYKLVVETFTQFPPVAFYVVVLLLLGMHLSHGFASSLQTLGLNGEKYDCKVKLAGKVYAVIVTVGFLSTPIYIFLTNN